jgi:predicted GNAT family N-acyltransferase
MMTTYIDPDTRTIADVVKLSVLAPADKTVPENVYLITRINVPHLHRGKGHGTKILNRIIEDADREGVILYVTPLSSGRWSQRALKSWYSRHGFLDSTEEYMIRNPVTP